jgi:hypothetical protein
MTTKEWHVGVFGRTKALRKGLMVEFRAFGLKAPKPLQRYALGKPVEMQRPSDLVRKPDA